MKKLLLIFTILLSSCGGNINQEVDVNDGICIVEYQIFWSNSFTETLKDTMSYGCKPYLTSWEGSNSLQDGKGTPRI